MSGGSDQHGGSGGGSRRSGGRPAGRDGADGRLQPADPRDLRRHPPTSAACVGVRDRLRDFLDGELPGREAAALERHVHECRSCGLALSRAELEVLRLRKAFEEERRQLEALPPGLTASILEAIEPEHFAAFGRGAVAGDDAYGGAYSDDAYQDDDASYDDEADDVDPFEAPSFEERADGSRGRRAGADRGEVDGRAGRERDPLDGWAVLDGEFTGRVMARVRREWQPAGTWARLRRQMAAHRTATIAAAGLLVAGLAFVTWVVLLGGNSDPAAHHGLMVADARRAHRSELGVGQLGVGQLGAEPTGTTAAGGPSATAPESAPWAASGAGGAAVATAGPWPGWIELAKGASLAAGTAFAVEPAGRLTLVDDRRYADAVGLDPTGAARPIDVDRTLPLRLQFLGAGLGRVVDHASLATAGLPWGDPAPPELPEGPVLDLAHGTVDLVVAGNRGRALPVSLGGFAWLVAEPDCEVSVTLLGVQRADPAVGPEASLAGRVEVLRGRVELWLGVRRESIAAGTVARFDPLGALALEPAAGRLLDDASLRDVAQGPVIPAVPLDDPAAWRGRVVRAESLAPVAGAEVRIAVGPGRHQVQTRRTGPDGWFAFMLDEPATRTAVLSIVPAAADGDLGIEPGLCVSLEAFGGRQRLLDPIELHVGREVFGAVRDAGVPVAGAEVRALVVDPIFGLVDGLGAARAVTDAAGEFRLAGLPRDLEPHQSLMVFVPQQAGKVPAAVAESAWRSRSGGLPLERSLRVDVDLPATRDVALVDLPADGDFTVFQAIPGVPITAMAVTLPVQRDAEGAAQLRGIGPGALFAVDHSGRRVFELAAVGSPADPNRLALGRDSAPDFVARVERLRIASAEGLGERRDAVLWSSPGERMGAPYAPRQSGLERRYLTVAHSSRLVAQPANLYIEFPDGRVEFLGVYDGGPSLAFDLPTERPFWLIAIGRDNGAIGVVEIGEGMTELPAVVEVASPGEVDLSAVLGAARQGMCAFRLLDGPLAGRTFWRTLGAGDQGIVGELPPGHYRVEFGDGTVLECEVEAGARVEAKPSQGVDVEGRGEPRRGG